MWVGWLKSPFSRESHSGDGQEGAPTLSELHAVLEDEAMEGIVIQDCGLTDDQQERWWGILAKLGKVLTIARNKFKDPKWRDTK